MGSVRVVVVDVVDDEAFELPLVPDDCSVEKLTAQGPDPALGECVRDGCADWGLEDLDAFGLVDLMAVIPAKNTSRLVTSMKNNR